jgi:hypothetical protein
MTPYCYLCSSVATATMTHRPIQLVDGSNVVVTDDQLCDAHADMFAYVTNDKRGR